ncbi:hypothetical protein M9434_002692 [Picochlorum sp. BPE23]|nr:hypothetical protein M9434_002692 [Picochlorum sp. BPE23]
MSSWGFKFPSLLTGFHLLASGAFVRVLKGNAGSASFTFELDTILLILWAVSSLVSLNLSLMLNTVSFYQATKLLIVPCSAVIEYFLLNTPLSRWRIWCIVQTLVGVALVTINDLEFDISVTGFTIAMISVLTSSLQQISVRKMQSEKQKSAMDLIAFIGPYSGMVLLTLSPFMDYKVSNQWITEFAWNPWVAGGVIVSAALAILVNISQYLCLGKFSAVEFQVMGHLKTVTVFIMCWLVLHESFSAIKWIGCVITIVGIYLFSRPPPQWRDPNGK